MFVPSSKLLWQGQTTQTNSLPRGGGKNELNDTMFNSIHSEGRIPLSAIKFQYYLDDML